MAEISFGEWLKRRRGGMGLTQQQLAARINYSTVALKKIEAEERRPSPEIVERLAEVFNIPAEERIKFLRFARGDWEAISDGDYVDTPWRRSTVQVEKQKEAITPRNNLPVQLTSFIGRKQEIIEIVDLITTHRLVSLVGAGGIGKTRLSLEVARKILDTFPDGVWFIELAPLADANLVEQVTINTLGLIEQANRTPQTILIDFLRDKQAMLILDNCEHLIQACAQLAGTLLRACPNLKILCTSREVLNILGETTWIASTLSLPDVQQSMSLDKFMEYDAIRLFVERASATLPAFALNTRNNAVAIAQVCQHLDGIPLALELAAARVKLLRVEEIAARLDDRFQLLTSGSRTAMPRHQTLKAMIDWSHDLLTEPERVLLRRLSIFAGGWTLEVAENVCADVGQDAILSDQVLDLLTSLVNKSLIIVERKQGQETRHHMLETMRQYAHAKLWEAGESELLCQWHLSYFLDLAERAEPNLRAFDMVMWLNRLEEELDNIRVALEYALECNIEAQLRIASSLLWFWHIRGHKNEGAEWLEKGLSIEAAKRGDKFLNPEHAMIRGKALNASGVLRLMLYDNDKGAAFSEESLQIFQGLGSIGKQGMAYALLNLSKVANQQMDLNRQKTLLEESLSLFQETGDRFGMAECIGEFVVNAYNDNDLEQTKILLEKVRALREEIGDKDGTAGLFIGLGYLAYQLSNYEQATLHFETSVVLFREVGNRWALGEALSNLARVTQAQGVYKRTIIILEEALVLAQDLGEKHTIADRLFHLGFAARSQGDYQRAIVMQEGALALVREFGDQVLVSKTLCWLGLAALDQNQHQQAINRFEQALTISLEIGEHFVTAFAYCCKARAAQAQNDFATARELYSRAIPLFLGYDAPLDVLYGGAFCLEGLAILAVTDSDMKQAGCLFSASEKFFPRLRSEMSARERAEHDQAIATARAALGEESFTAAWEEGKKMTLDEAVAFARIRV